jgi:hypothetical protein
LLLISLIAGLALYAAALVAPAIIYKPDVRSNPKYGVCVSTVKDNVNCEAFPFRGDGSLICDEDAKPDKTYIDKAKILDYCKGWDVPMARSSYGYELLLMGWVVILDGTLAWLANPLMLIAVSISGLGTNRAAAKILSVLAIVLGLQSYAFDGVPFTGGSSAADNLNSLDRLGLGFYLWMASLLAFAAYCFLKKPTPSPGQRATAPA